MDEHTICVRLDHTDPEKKYRVIFDGEYTATPDVDNLFWFKNAQPVRRYIICCEEEVEPGVWDECCPAITVNFVPPVKEENDLPHIVGGKLIHATRHTQVVIGKPKRR